MTQGDGLVQVVTPTTPAPYQLEPQAAAPGPEPHNCLLNSAKKKPSNREAVSKRLRLLPYSKPPLASPRKWERGNPR